jgi:hypothetical protein
MKRFALLSAFVLADVIRVYAQAPGTNANPSPAQTGQAHIATPSPKSSDGTTNRRNDANRTKANPPNNPGVKEPIRNPANGPVGTPTNPK